MKVFISQPMRDRSEEDILSERDEIMKFAKSEFPDEQVNEIASYFGPNHRMEPLEALGLAIQMMQNADVVYFAPGWQAADGCFIEHQCAELYDKTFVEITRDVFTEKLYPVLN